MNDIIRWLTILFIVLTLGLRLADAQAPTIKKCDHDSNSLERFSAMRILPPSHIFWDGVTVTATFKEGAEILTTDKNSVLHIPTDYKNKLFWIIFDSCDRYTYVVDEVAPGQMRKK